MYFVYILRCRDGSLYTGITTDVARRLAEHKAGTASKYTRAHKADAVVHTERFKTRSRASKRESDIKSWSRERKLKLVNVDKVLIN